MSVYIDFDGKSIRSIAKLPSYQLTLNAWLTVKSFDESMYAPSSNVGGGGGGI